MIYIEKYNKDKVYYFPNGRKAGENEFISLYPAIEELPYLVTTDYTRQIVISVEMLDIVRTRFNIDTNLSDEEAVAALETSMEEANSNSNSIEERIASALEFQSMMMLPDMEELL